MIRPWFRVLARMSRPGQPSPTPTPAGRRPSVRLRLEAVEDRTVTSAVAAEPLPPPPQEAAWVRPADPAPPADPSGARAPIADLAAPNLPQPKPPTPAPADALTTMAGDVRSAEVQNPPAPAQSPSAADPPAEPDRARDTTSQVRQPGATDPADGPKARRAGDPETATPSSADASPAPTARPAARPDGTTTAGAPVTPPAAPASSAAAGAPQVPPSGKPNEAGVRVRPVGPAPVGPDASGVGRPARPADLSGPRTDHRLAADLSDGALLQRFVADRDQSAFTALVQRHGPLVLAVCRRVLGDWNAAQDASQATFLVLARKAGLLDRHSPLGGWLYKVAYRLALRSRVVAARHQATEWEAGSEWAAERATEYPADDLAQAELRQVLREELQRLPEKYRAPLTLCYFDGRTHADAAREIGLPRGSLAKRIGEGLEHLRERLLVRGVTV